MCVRASNYNVFDIKPTTLSAFHFISEVVRSATASVLVEWINSKQQNEVQGIFLNCIFIFYDQMLYILYIFHNF